ncbi:MAG: hypothetical protein ACR2QM_14830, partial [Longimicrobiales bacterium]
MKSTDPWSDENLTEMRNTGDQDADDLVRKILEEVTPDDVSRTLHEVADAVNAVGTAIENLPTEVADRSIEPGELRSESKAAFTEAQATLKNAQGILVHAEFRAGAFRVLDCMKVAGAALVAAQSSLTNRNLPSALRFVAQTSKAIE